MNVDTLLYMTGALAIFSAVTGWFHGRRTAPSGPATSPAISRAARREDRADRERRRQLRELAALRRPF
jgi:hypothetical protein